MIDAKLADFHHGNGIQRPFRHDHFGLRSVEDHQTVAMQLCRDHVFQISFLHKQISKRLPGYDCGSCGSPTCHAFAEDIVQGFAREMDCVHILKEQLRLMAQQMVHLAESTRE